MPPELIVPDTAKNEVKSLRGAWLPKRKTWVVPDHIADIDLFKAWIPIHNGPTCIVLKNIDPDFDYHIDASFGGMAYDDIFFPENKAQLAKQGIRVHILK